MHRANVIRYIPLEAVQATALLGAVPSLLLRWALPLLAPVHGCHLLQLQRLWSLLLLLTAALSPVAGRHQVSAGGRRHTLGAPCLETGRRLQTACSSGHGTSKHA